MPACTTACTRSSRSDVTQVSVWRVPELREHVQRFDVHRLGEESQSVVNPSLLTTDTTAFARRCPGEPPLMHLIPRTNRAPRALIPCQTCPPVRAVALLGGSQGSQS